MRRKWSNDCQQPEGQHQKSADVISTFKRVLSNLVQRSSSKRLAETMRHTTDKFRVGTFIYRPTEHGTFNAQKVCILLTAACSGQR